MQTVLPFSRMSEAAERMDPKVLAYLNEGQIETFESFETFSIIAFDWYDVHSARTADSQMLLYLDRKDLLLFCEDDAAEEKARSIVGAIGVSEAHVHSHGTCQLHGFFYQKIQTLHHLCGPGKAIRIRRPQTDHHQIALIGHAPVPASAFPSIPCGDPSHRRSMSSRIC